MPSHDGRQTFLSFVGDEKDRLEEPPVAPLLQTLPLTRLSWKTFEQLCCRLVERMPEIEGTPHLYGVPGDEQDGIDIIAQKRAAGVLQRWGYQCKKYDNLYPGDLEEAIKGLKYEADYYVFFLAGEAQASLRRVEDKYSRVELWDSVDISRRLKNHPDLVAEFFHPAWVELFCGVRSHTSRPAGGRLQNLRDFTVQIRHPVTDVMVGTGIAVSTSGQIVTCAQIVCDTLGVGWRETASSELSVFFPRARESEIRLRRAKVSHVFADHDDDIVLLQLIDGPSPLTTAQIPVLGTAELSVGNSFRSYGYSPTGALPARYVGGKIMGPVESSPDSKLRAELIELWTQEACPPISGAAVLDEDRNLVVGLISRGPAHSTDKVEEHIRWAVNTFVLSCDPFNLPVQDAPVPLSIAPRPDVNVTVRESAVLKPGISLYGAPPRLTEWVGRDSLLQKISEDWDSPERRVTGLIGLGGEGKSSLARRWVDGLAAGTSGNEPDGILWWSFYDRPSVDEFFEAALEHFGGGSIDARQYPSNSAKAHLIAAMLTQGGFVFVLDGLEVLQHNVGDKYGLVTNDSLREFLTFFATPGHNSFCLVTSRIPLLDLISYTTYSHRTVDRLSTADGRDLLRKLGLIGDDTELERVVTEWDGHALTLSLVGSYLLERHNGDVAKLSKICAPTSDEPLYERIHYVLRRYDEHLPEAGRVFLIMFSAFRTPVTEEALRRVFRKDEGPGTLNAPLAALDDAAFENLINRLVSSRLLRYDPEHRQYTTHPLIRTYYLKRLAEQDVTQCKALHRSVKEFYLLDAQHVLDNPTLDEYLSSLTLEDLSPFAEAVHHACSASDYDEAYEIHWMYTREGGDHILTSRLGAYETQLATVRDFFPENDTSLDPQVSDPHAKRFLIHEVGFCLMSLGQLSAAAEYYERALKITLGLRDWSNSSIINGSLAALYTYVGDLKASVTCARAGAELARRARISSLDVDPVTLHLHESAALCRLAWSLYLTGDPGAGKVFQQAQAVQRILAPGSVMFGAHQYADYLRREGKISQAREVIKLRLENFVGYSDEMSFTYRILGDLEAGAKRHDNARRNYDQALKIGRGVTRRSVVIEALVARGRWAALQGDIELAKTDLDEAINLALTSGYRLYEADIRVGLGLTFNAVRDTALAREQAEEAYRISSEMGYHWGKVDATGLVGMINKQK